MDFKVESRRVKAYLGLRFSPVAITYSTSPDPRGKNGKLYVCTALRRAARGEVINLSREKISCPGALHWLGFENYRPGIQFFLTYVEKIFKDDETAGKWFDAVPAPPLGRAPFVILSPLEHAGSGPAAVCMIATPHQAHLVLTALTFSTGPFEVKNMDYAVCQAAITNPVSAGQAVFTSPDTVGAEVGGYADDETIVSLPMGLFERFAEDMEKPECGKPGFTRKMMRKFNKIKG